MRAGHSVKANDTVTEHIRLVASEHEKELDLAALRQILAQMADGIRKAATLAEANVAAGIAYELLGELEV